MKIEDFSKKIQWNAHCSRNGIDMFTSVNTILNLSIEGNINDGYILEAKNKINLVRHRLEKKSLKKCFIKAQKICDKNQIEADNILQFLRG
jgi:hypothetical protein